MFFLIFLELHLLDLCVDMAESSSKWLFDRSVWKIFLTCEEKYFSSHVMDFSVKKKIDVLTKLPLSTLCCAKRNQFEAQVNTLQMKKDVTRYNWT